MSESKVTVFVAKHVITMDPGRPRSVRGGGEGRRVVSTGVVESMQTSLSRLDVPVDGCLSDQVIRPGRVEPHSHRWMSAVDALQRTTSRAEPGRPERAEGEVSRQRGAAGFR